MRQGTRVAALAPLMVSYFVSMCTCSHVHVQHVWAGRVPKTQTWFIDIICKLCTLKLKVVIILYQVQSCASIYLLQI